MRAAPWLWLLAALAISGCLKNPAPAWLTSVPDAEPYGVFHTVAAGENLSGICRRYKASLQEVAEVNGIDDPSQLRVGQIVFIPDAQPVAGAGNKPEKIKKFKGRFIWPCKGVLTSKYGLRWGRRHDGIDIGAPSGTAVVASAAGEVLYVGSQRGYGNLVILKHADKMITVYAHNRKNTVSDGHKVEQGEKIAEVGRTGRATGPHLHFEIRQGTKPRNPLFFLPRPK